MDKYLLDGFTNELEKIALSDEAKRNIKVGATGAIYGGLAGGIGSMAGQTIGAAFSDAKPGFKKLYLQKYFLPTAGKAAAICAPTVSALLLINSLLNKKYSGK